ncbi:uncharacterized protein LOC135633821 [Musa acuminata AAA Group]|uniref:(wild Malaysian banana) hypothetical protein n=1 Tax=Musa acuminata subsp. malaccensis TaxID=214687 RepID=A0A804I7T0_MUSAM|nr:PREDICTED: uncharacterized protein LOC103977071 [Musa acuminata subsp. malaccensis]CAG1848985.1 unnamed protein product [Musa acuminata subsp. malaccensis]
MGNCLVREERRAIKNGEILSYQTPLMAQQVRDESEAAAGARAIRIKLVVTKQELKEMLRQGGVSHDAMASLIQREESRSGAGDKERCMEWRPTLESIPEWSE